MTEYGGDNILNVHDYAGEIHLFTPFTSRGQPMTAKEKGRQVELLLQQLAALSRR